MLNKNIMMLSPPIRIDYERKFIFPETSADFNTTASYSFPSTLDGDPVVRTYNNFTVNTGHTVTTSNRCKGLYIYIKNNLTINGTLTMTAKGAVAAGRYITINYKENFIGYVLPSFKKKENYFLSTISSK